MKLIIAGGSNIVPSVNDIEKLLKEHKITPTKILSDCHKGVSRQGIEYAKKNNIEIGYFTPAIDLSGRKQNNRTGDMVDDCDAVLLIYSKLSKRIDNLIRLVHARNKKMIEIRVGESLVPVQKTGYRPRFY